MKKRIVLLLLLSVPLSAQAQQSPVSAAKAANPSVVCRDSINTNYVSLSGGYIEGNDKAYSMPLSEWNIVASGATLQHFGPVSFATHASFTEAMAYDARGTVFLTPFLYPIDFYEKVLGVKDRRKYALNASVGTNLSHSWRLGLGIDFLGHTLNKDNEEIAIASHAISFAVRPGAEWHNDNGLSVGIAAFWDGCWERDINPINGTTPKEFEVFAWEALGYGRTLTWSQGNVDLWGTKASCLAVDSWNCGASVRVAGRNVTGEVTYRHGDGYIGEPDAKMATFPSNNFIAHVDGNWRSAGDWIHDASLDFSIKSTDFRHDYHGYDAFNNTLNTEVRPHYAFSTPSRWRVVFDTRYARQDDKATLVPDRTSTLMLRSASLTTRLQHNFGRLSAEFRVAGGSGFLNLNDALAGLTGSDITFDASLFYGFVWYVTRPWYGSGLSLSYVWKNGLGINAATDFTLSGLGKRPRYLSPEVEVPSNITTFRHRTTSSLGISYNF